MIFWASEGKKMLGTTVPITFMTQNQPNTWKCIFRSKILIFRIFELFWREMREWGRGFRQPPNLIFSSILGFWSFREYTNVFNPWVLPIVVVETVPSYVTTHPAEKNLIFSWFLVILGELSSQKPPYPPHFEWIDLIEKKNFFSIGQKILNYTCLKL